MASFLIGVHAGLGEMAIFGALWIFVELLSPTAARVKRAQLISLAVLAFICLSWLIGGFYYLTEYGKVVKPVILNGPQPWGHEVFTEVKEHVFLFLPFLSAFLVVILMQCNVLKDKNAWKAALLIAGLIVLLGLSMVGMGYMISTAARSGLEASV